ncbi:MAG TPA: hypothetical protein VH416_08280 [Gaiellaceae bacterium]
MSAILAAVGAHEYRLVVEGELSDRMERAFEGMTLTREDGNTALAGTLDQAQLQGQLRRVLDLGLTLLSAVAIDEDDER